MTTVVYKDGIIASDGRAAIGNRIAQENIKKIYEIEGCLVGFAGRLASGLEFVEWFRKDIISKAILEDLPEIAVRMPKPLEDEDFEALIVYPTGEVFEYEGGTHCFEVIAPYHVLGSGGSFAAGALEAGATAEEAVKIATKLDIYSGGEIRTLALGKPLEEITREKAETMSKKELIEAFYGPEEVELVEGGE